MDEDLKSAFGLVQAKQQRNLEQLDRIIDLAVQDSLGNLAAGATILTNRPFDVDDHIRVAGTDGLVKRMNWLATTIVTFDNQVLVVPNRRIWGDTIVNFTASHVRRVDVKVNFAYAEDSDRVHQVLMEGIEQHPLVLEKVDTGNTDTPDSPHSR